jgi:5'-nucleotidase
VTVPWKFCQRHQFTFVYGNRCPNCLSEEDATVSRRITCDLDSIVVDLCTDWFAEHNRRHGDDLHMSRVTKWETHEFAKGGKAVYEVLKQPGFFRTLKPLAGAVEALRAIHEAKGPDGKPLYELRLVSAASFPENLTDKALWCAEHLPFISFKSLKLLDDKHNYPADYLIDDSPHQISAMAATQPKCRILTIAYPYNEQVRDLCHLRAEGWRDPARAWKAIGQYLNVA